MFKSIQLLSETKLVGKSIRSSLANIDTYSLWNSFMKEQNKVQNKVSNNLYSVQKYNPNLNFLDFNEHTLFTKWATVAVTDFDNCPESMENLIIPKGLYAVFTHKGDSSEFHKTSKYIFRDWLPKSNYILDNRPHFEILGSDYKYNNPNSKEEVWIPISKK